MKALLEKDKPREAHSSTQRERETQWRTGMTFEESTEPIAGFFMSRVSLAPVPLQLSQPHRHDFQEIKIIQSGQGRHIIDGQSIEFRPQSVCFVPKDYVHIAEQNSGMTGWMVQFSDDFLPADFIDQNWNYRTALSDQLGPMRTLDLRPDEMQRIERMLELMEAEYLCPSNFQKQSLRHWLSLLIIQIGRLSQDVRRSNHHEQGEVCLFQKFMAMLEHDFARHHDVGHYAAALNTDPVNLSKILGRILGKSTKNLIEERIILEAKRDLLYTGTSIKEIAFNLGYIDQFHFSKSFKRLVGMAPQAFRALRQ